MAEEQENDLNARQERLLAALLSTSTIREACAVADVAERTARSWMKEDPTFRKMLRIARSEAMDVAVAKLADLAAKAVQTLGKLLDSDAEGIRMYAAKAILDFGPKLTEHVDLCERIEALEAAAAKRGGR